MITSRFRLPQTNFCVHKLTACVHQQNIYHKSLRNPNWTSIKRLNTAPLFNTSLAFLNWKLGLFFPLFVNTISTRMLSTAILTSQKGFYDVLGVKKSDSVRDIKKAYYELAKMCHPDTSLSSVSSERFQEVQEAYEVLSNATKRAEYDRNSSGGGGGGGETWPWPNKQPEPHYTRWNSEKWKAHDTDFHDDDYSFFNSDIYWDFCDENGFFSGYEQHSSSGKDWRTGYQWDSATGGYKEYVHDKNSAKDKKNGSKQKESRKESHSNRKTDQDNDSERTSKQSFNEFENRRKRNHDRTGTHSKKSRAKQFWNENENQTKQNNVRGDNYQKQDKGRRRIYRTQRDRDAVRRHSKVHMTVKISSRMASQGGVKDVGVLDCKRGSNEGEQTISVVVPAGVSDGNVMDFQWNAGKEYGVLVVRFRIRNRKKFWM